MSNYFDMPSEGELELAHHGILGQRWGIRRYQNDDGSLTPAGRARYGTVENLRKVQNAKANAEAYKIRAKAEAKLAKENSKLNRKIAKKEAKLADKIAKREDRRQDKIAKEDLKRETKYLKEETKAMLKEQKRFDKKSNNDYRNNQDRKFKRDSAIKAYGKQFVRDAVVPATINFGKNVLEKYATDKLNDFLMDPKEKARKASISNWKKQSESNEAEARYLKSKADLRENRWMESHYDAQDANNRYTTSFKDIEERRKRYIQAFGNSGKNNKNNNNKNNNNNNYNNKKH